MKTLIRFVFCAALVLSHIASSQAVSALIIDSIFSNDHVNAKKHFQTEKYSTPVKETYPKVQNEGQGANNRPSIIIADEPSNVKDTEEELLSSSGWLPLGPESIPPTYDEYSSNGMGRVNCIAFHPTDKDIFWVGTPGGGIWKTIDGGKNWIPLSDNAPTLEISDIAVDKNNPEIIYAATGDFDEKGLSSARAMGVMKSTDGGASWKVNDSLRKKIKGRNLKRIIINADDSNEILACGPGGAWKSTDAGETWRKVSTFYFGDLDVDPNHSNVIYAAVYGNIDWRFSYPGVIKSADFGETWEKLNIIGMDADASRLEIAISPADPNYIYGVAAREVLLHDDMTTSFKAVYLSTDAGKTWKEQTNYMKSGNILGRYNGDSVDIRGQGRYDLVLLADTKDKHKIYVGGINIWMSTDDGASWDIASYFNKSFGPSVHNDQHAAAINPLDNKIYWCNDGGVYRTDEIMSGSKEWVTNWIDRSTGRLKPGSPDMKFPTVWENLSDGLMITEFYKLSFSKNYPSAVAAGAKDNSFLYYRENHGWVNIAAYEEGMETAIDNNNPDLVYGASSYGSLFKTTDGGKTVRRGLTDSILYKIKDKGNLITPFIMSPNNSSILYIGFVELWRSQDGGDTWTRLTDHNDHETGNHSSISVLNISPFNPNYIAYYKIKHQYLNLDGMWLETLPAVFSFTTNGGADWQRPTKFDDYHTEFLTSIEYDPVNPNKMWVTAQPDTNAPNNCVAYSIDGGKRWNWLVRDNNPKNINVIAAHGDAKNTVYIGSQNGVYYTNDDMTEWKRLEMNLPNAIVTDLEIDYNSERLYASTFGRGIWYRSIGEGGVTDKKTIPISVYPNPSHGEFKLDFTGVESASPIEVKILNVQGRRVYSGSFRAGAPATIASDLPTGVYFVVATVNGSTMSAKIEIEK